MAWITEHPPASVDLDSCVTCGLCLPVCPTFRLTGDETASPRGRLTAIAAVDAGLAGVDQRFADITGFCLQCRACETACPSMVPYGEIIEDARAEVVAQVPDTVPRHVGVMLGRVVATPWVLRVASIVLAVLQRMRLAPAVPIVGRQAAGLRPVPLPVPSARGGVWGPSDGERVTFFTGCVADPWFSDIHRASIEVLVAAGYRVEATSSQTCCGALAAHSGLAHDARRLAEANIAALGTTDLVAVDVAGCGAHLKSYGRRGDSGTDLAGRIRDIDELVASAISDGRLPRLPPRGEHVAIQDPCHLEHGQGITAEPRLIIEAAGYEVIDADPGGLCCGAAGVYQLDHPETGATLGAAKAEAVRDTGATLVASANAGCEMQLRRFLGAGYVVRHPVEIYREAMRSEL